MVSHIVRKRDYYILSALPLTKSLVIAWLSQGASGQPTTANGYDGSNVEDWCPWTAMLKEATHRNVILILREPRFFPYSSREHSHWSNCKLCPGLKLRQAKKKLLQTLIFAFNHIQFPLFRSSLKEWFKMSTKNAAGPTSWRMPDNQTKSKASLHHTDWCSYFQLSHKSVDEITD